MWKCWYFLLKCCLVLGKVAEHDKAFARICTRLLLIEPATDPKLAEHDKKLTRLCEEKCGNLQSYSVRAILWNSIFGDKSSGGKICQQEYNINA